MPVTVYMGLGSNLDNPELQLQRGVDHIASDPNIYLLKCSKLYRSKPLGPSGQADYCNAVISVSSNLQSECLLDRLQAVEKKHGRMRAAKWGPRTLDIDMLLYGDEVISTLRLTIPHNQMHLRSFVLYPLGDVAPDIIVPGRGVLSSMLDNVDSGGLNVIAESWPWL